jgi:hypothetical protein
LVGSAVVAAKRVVLSVFCASAWYLMLDAEGGYDQVSSERALFALMNELMTLTNHAISTPEHDDETLVNIS